MSNAYPKYKSSGVEWLGDVPEHWYVKKLKHTAYLFGRIGFRGYTTDDLVDEGEGAITLSPSNMKNGEIDLIKSTYISWEKYYESPEIMIKPDDIVIVKTGSTFGKIAYVRKVEHPITLNPQLAVFKRLKCNNRFFFYYIGAPYIQDQISLSNTGSTIPTMTQQTIMSYAIPLPPLPEQQAIAAFLDRETGRIDALIAKKQRLLKLLAEQRTALISRAVTRGLDASVKLKPSGVEWLGDPSTGLGASVPEHWEVKRLKYKVTVNDDSLPEITDPDYEMLYVDISSVDPTQGIIKKEQMLFENAPSRARRIVRDGDTIVSTVRTYLRAISPVTEPEENLIVSTGFAVIRPRKLDKGYLSAIIRSSYFIEEVVSRSVGVSYPAINASEIGLISIPLPPLPEQQAIAAFLDRETAKIDVLSDKVTTVIEKLKEYRTALISSTVTGKIDVREAV